MISGRPVDDGRGVWSLGLVTWDEWTLGLVTWDEWTWRPSGFKIKKKQNNSTCTQFCYTHELYAWPILTHVTRNRMYKWSTSSREVAASGPATTIRRTSQKWSNNSLKVPRICRFRTTVTTCILNQLSVKSCHRWRWYVIIIDDVEVQKAIDATRYGAHSVQNQNKNWRKQTPSPWPLINHPPTHVQCLRDT